MPTWLEKPEGTINIGVVGNSGVGKSLLINKLRNARHGMEGWAPVGINETTLKISMYAFHNERRARLWDCPGAGTPAFPLATYVDSMGLRYFDRVLIVSAGRFTEIDMELMGKLMEHKIPHCMVRTKVDMDVLNNLEDNKVSAEVSVAEMYADMKSRGVAHPYLVSLRDTEAYDFQQLLCDIFPGMRDLKDGDALGGCWDDAWALPQVLSGALGDIQGRWRDSHDTLYIIQGLAVHVTCPGKGQATSALTEDEGGLHWLAEYTLDESLIAVASKRGQEVHELQWHATPRPGLRSSPSMVWRR